MALEKEVCYLSARLKKKLADVFSHPLTLVEAPAGFGKTTAVRQFLKEGMPQNAKAYWCTSFGEPASITWKGICMQLSKIDAGTGDALLRLGYPDAETIGIMTEVLQDIDSYRESVLVIDNYQLIPGEIPEKVIGALSLHGNERLHIIVITQPLEKTLFKSVMASGVLRVEADDLLFRIEDVRDYFKAAGAPLSEEDLQKVLKNTGGWISALQLLLFRYKETGQIEREADIDRLLEISVWNPLPESSRNLLLVLARMDSFSVAQVCTALELSELPADVNDLLTGSPFIRFFPENRHFAMHDILREYLERRLSDLSEDRASDIYRRAGDALAAGRRNYLAMKSYFQAGDYDALLSIPLKIRDLTEYMGDGSDGFLMKILQNCPKSFLLRYPKMLLICAFELFLLGELGGFSGYAALLGEALETPGLLEGEVFREVAGEYALLMSFTKFNDILTMSKAHRQAQALLEGSSGLFDFDNTWTFGIPSALCLFWRKSGDLPPSLDRMDECMPIYSSLVRGHGTGAAPLMRAEAMLLAGELEKAEVHSYKALYLADGKEQDSICLGAELTLARAAVLRGDEQALSLVKANIHQRVLVGVERSRASVADQCDAWISLLLERPEEVPLWIGNKDEIRKRVYGAGVPFTMILQGAALLQRKEYGRLEGIAEPVMEISAKLGFALPTLYFRIFLAAACLEQKRLPEAREQLHSALEAALPDKVYLPFAEFGGALAGLIKEMENPQNRIGIESVLKVIAQQKQGVGQIQNVRNRPILTPREREVAKLAQEGLTVKAAAEQLGITENTARTILRSAYAKLEVHSRVQLSKKLL